MDLGGLPLAVGRRMIRRKAHSNSVGTATKGNQSGSPHPRQLPPISLLVHNITQLGLVSCANPEPPGDDSIVP